MSCPLAALASIAALSAPSPVSSPASSNPGTPRSQSYTFVKIPMAGGSTHKPVKKRSFQDLDASSLSSHGSSHSGSSGSDNFHPNLTAAVLSHTQFQYGAAWEVQCRNDSHKRAKTMMTGSSGSKNSKVRTKGKKVAKKKKKRKSRANGQSSSADRPAFPTVLMGIMSAPQNSSYLTFLSDDASFIIIDPDAVATKVLSLHFEGPDMPTTYEQFVTLLALWGFEVVKDPQYPQVNVYRHTMFKRGDWEACLRMKMPGRCTVAREDQECMMQAMSASGSARSVGSGSLASSSGRTPIKQEFEMYAGTSALSHSSSRSSLCSTPETRSVTPSSAPPEELALPASMLPHRALSRSLSQESSSRLVKQSAVLEKMILATAETRRGLSGMRSRDSSFDEMVHNVQGRPTSQTSSDPARLSPKESKNLSDAQVGWMTSSVVSAAVAALHGTNEQPKPKQPMRKSATISASSSNSSLDKMTEVFLERSNKRRMQTRPDGIFGAAASSAARYSDMVDARTRALLARTAAMS